MQRVVRCLDPRAVPRYCSNRPLPRRFSLESTNSIKYQTIKVLTKTGHFILDVNSFVFHIDQLPPTAVGTETELLF